MAIAGRVLLMPKGAYDASVTYEMLDMVSYDGVTWVARKASVGITPSADNAEYWFAMVGVSSEDFEAFKKDVLDSVNESIRESEASTNEKIKDVVKIPPQIVMRTNIDSFYINESSSHNTDPI